MAEDIWQALPYDAGYKSVFESGWVEMQDEWQKPELKQFWTTIANLRDEVNKVMEQARTAKAIGSSLDAKVLLNVADADLKNKLASYNSSDTLSEKNVDELRYFFLASQVELVDSLPDAEYKSESDIANIAVVKADGH